MTDMTEGDLARAWAPRVPEPRRIAKLHHDPAGRPVPWFVQWFDGETPGDAGVGRPDFRIVDSRKLVKALQDRLCFICGEQFHGPTETFPIGPMCVVNRISSEPPSHRECAEHAVHVCPWILNPEKLRRGEDGPGRGTVAPVGMVPRNPGVIVLWKCRAHELIRVGDSVLIELGEPQRLTWFREGREATDYEIAESFASGLEILLAQAQREGPASLHRLRRDIDTALTLLPPGAVALLNPEETARAD